MAGVLDNDDPFAALATPATGGGQLASPTTTTASGSGSVTPASPSSSPTSTSVNAQPQTQSDIDRIGSLNSNVDFSPLLSSVSQVGDQARSAIDTAQNSFNTALGTAPTFDDTAKSTLTGAINGTQPLSAGQNLLNTSYSGPAGLDTSQFSKNVADYQSKSDLLASPDHLQDFIQQNNPALTPGEARFDSLAYNGNPNFQPAVKNLASDASNLSATGTKAATDASNAVTQRKSDIGAFDTAAKGYVQSQADNINSLVGNQMTGATNSDNSLQQLFNSLKAGTGSFASAPTGSLKFDPSQYSPAEFSSKYGKPVFDQTVAPNSYLTYTAGDTPNRNNVATQDEATQYNNAEQLLNLFDRLNPAARNASSIGIDSGSYQAALQQALSRMQAADSAYGNAHASAPSSPLDNVTLGPPIYSGDAGHDGAGPSPGAGADSGTTGVSSHGIGDMSSTGLSGALGGAASASPTGSNTTGNTIGNAVGTAANLAGIPAVGTLASIIGNTVDTQNALPAGMNVSVSDKLAMGLKDTFIGRLAALLGIDIGETQTEAAANTLNNHAQSLPADISQNDVNSDVATAAAQNSDTSVNAPQSKISSVESLSAPEAPSAAPDAPSGEADGEGDGEGDSGDGSGNGGEFKGGFVKPSGPAFTEALKRFNGGKIPNSAPAGRDNVPTLTTRGEFVQSLPAVNAVGPDNMVGLNNVGSLPAQKQAVVRNALHSALSRMGAM